VNPADLALLRIPSEPTLTPDGAVAAVTVTRLDLDADAYRSEIFVAPTDGSAAPRRLTDGPRDSLPRFSPDGRWLAFLRTEDAEGAEQEKPQLHVMPADGGEPRQVCQHHLGVSRITWSPDSTRIAYCARVPEEGRYGTDPDRPAGKEPPRRITTLNYRLDGVGFTIDRRSHVFVVDALADGAVPVQVTDGDFDDVMPAWHPDGRRLAFVSARHATRDEDLLTDVFLVDAQGGEPAQLTETRWVVADPAFTPDGQTVVFASHGHPDVVGRPDRLWALPLGGGQPRPLSNPERHDVRSFQVWAPLAVDEAAVTTFSLERGAIPLLRFGLDGGEPEVLLGGERWVTGYAAAGAVVAATVADGTSAGELVVLRDGAEQVLSTLGAGLAGGVDLRPLVEITTAANDGYPVHGWLVKPAGPGPHPVLLSIHGGPHTQYGHHLFDEAQIYAGAGYAVVLGNPRGSSGYGETHGRAVVGAFGDRDTADLLALLDAAVDDPDLDGDRVGVMGGSYGGFMTTWLAAHHGARFTAAISERALNAPDSFLGTSDIGPHFIGQYFGTDPDAIAAQNPLAHADDIDIPTLVVHAEQDLRCPLEQAQRLYVALKLRGVPTEMLVFPGEGHELSRSGLPSHRVARFDAILAWWARWLPVER
jgi:dipeptidyl aminopeptidase/acylaminoacyl peptidase